MKSEQIKRMKTCIRCGSESFSSKFCDTCAVEISKMQSDPLTHAVAAREWLQKYAGHRGASRAELFAGLFILFPEMSPQRKAELSQ